MREKTYCNPLPLPDYPEGRLSPDKQAVWGWDHPDKPDFRELADPTVLYHNGSWYLYPSGRMVYVTDDFVHWRHHRMEPEDIGYAPTVVESGRRFLLTACGAGMYVADSPLGPFREVGKMRKPDGSSLENWNDPMLFTDDDGRLYAYWGLGGPGIFGAELDRDQPFQLLSEPEKLFAYDPEHIWERLGDFNENPAVSYVEGAWMLKHDGRYFLTYAAPGTEFRSYAMGCYVGDAPLGPFRYQERNPILRDTEGLVNGPGHGCIVKGPGNTLWAFYTCLVRIRHYFERRVGMDPAGFDEDGNLFVAGASEVPQLAPGICARPELGNGTGLVDAAAGSAVSVSSFRPGFPGEQAVDGEVRTYWAAAEEDRAPTVRVSLGRMRTVAAVRLLWAEPDLGFRVGQLPGPFRYVLEGKAGGEDWHTLLDCSQNTVDYLIDYRTFPAREVEEVRLTVAGAPGGAGVGLISLSLFATEPSA